MVGARSPFSLSLRLEGGREEGREGGRDGGRERGREGGREGGSMRVYFLYVIVTTCTVGGYLGTKFTGQCRLLANRLEAGDGSGQVLAA